jgi:hypothetical protein
MSSNRQKTTKLPNEFKRKREIQNVISGVPLNSCESDTVCACEYNQVNMSYSNAGCIKCTKMESAYYIQNFSETILSFYTTT